MAREVVYKANGYTVKWNGSSTFNIYRGNDEIDVWTEYGVDNVTDAKRSAEKHMSDYEDTDASEGHWYTR